MPRSIRSAASQTPPLPAPDEPDAWCRLHLGAPSLRSSSRLKRPKQPLLLLIGLLLCQHHPAAGAFDELSQPPKKMVYLEADRRCRPTSEKGLYSDEAISACMVALDLACEVFGADSKEAVELQKKVIVLFFIPGKLERVEQSSPGQPAIRLTISGNESAKEHIAVQPQQQVQKQDQPIFVNRGWHGDALPVWEEVLSEQEKELGTHHPYLLPILDMLAGMYQQRERDQDALSMHVRGLTIRSHQFGESHPSVAASIQEIASIHHRHGNAVLAGQLFRRALAILTRVSGDARPVLAKTMHGLASVYLAQAEYYKAESLLRRALALEEKLPDHGIGARVRSLNHLASCYLAHGHWLDAVPVLNRAATLLEAELGSVSSESLTAAILDFDYRRLTEEMIFHLLIRHPKSHDLRRLALSVILLRKGRTAESAAALRGAVHGNPAAQALNKLWQERQSLSRQRSTLVRQGPGPLSPERHQQQLVELQARIDKQDDEMHRAWPQLRSPPLSSLSRVVSDVARHLDRSSALIEFVHAPDYRFGGDTSGTSHYLALILFRDRRIEVQDLGPADRIDGTVIPLLAELTNRKSNPLAAAQNAYRLIFAPLESKLHGVQHAELSLDGSLQLIPFAALHDGHGYLLDRYQFRHLTTGRDLLRKPAPPSSQPPLVLADPDVAPAAARGRLPGAAREGKAVAELLDGAQLLLGPEATEQALRTAPAPCVLHIAAHGDFQAAAQTSEPAPTGTGLAKRVGPSPAAAEEGAAAAASVRWHTAVPPVTMRLREAMTRSALFLAGAAGAAQRASLESDGILTAEELAGLDLWGTQLVVLSACDSGRGEPLTGQGVYGLRRAVLVAGVETLVISLWRVDDEQTGDLMKIYYQKLVAGRPRMGALQEAMTELKQRLPHPYYWAPFIAIGSRDIPLSCPLLSRGQVTRYGSN